MNILQIVILVLVVFLLPSIIFKVVDPKKLLDGLDNATKNMNKQTEKVKEKNRVRHQNMLK